MKKTSFVYYEDWRNAIRGLPDNIRLEIYECTVDYALYGEIKELKPMAKMAFNFIKPIIDRDNSKYVSIVEAKSQAGSLGNLKRWHKDIYDNVISNKITLEEGLIIANHRTAIILSQTSLLMIMRMIMRKVV